jgi:hypothetical protein
MIDKHWPELDDAQLLAHLDGEEDPNVAAHLAECARCQDRARQLAAFHDRLTAGLYRHGCPSSTDLGEYHLGLLPREGAAAISRHLAECPHCTREVVQLEQYLADLAPDVALGPLEQVKIVIAELVRGVQGLGQLPTFAPAPVYAGVRGEEAGPLVYEGDDYQIMIEIQRDGERRDRHALLGLVTGPDPGELEAHLWAGGELLATAPIDELGNLFIANLPPGLYDLNLSGGQVEIQIQALQVGEP